MAETNPEAPKPQAKRYRRWESVKEWRETRRAEKVRKGEIKHIKTRKVTENALEALEKDKPDIADRKDLENLANLEQPTPSPPEISPPRQKEINVDQVQHEGFDKWNASGSMQINGDYLSFLPEIKKEDNPYVPGNRYYDAFEKYGYGGGDPEEFPRAFIDHMKKRVERGINLAIIPDPKLVDPEIAKMAELKKVPSPALWAILEENPNSHDKKNKLLVSVGSLETIRTAVSVYDPDDNQVKDREGDLGYSWNGVAVDKETLVDMQHKALEYLEAQVNAGEMPQAVLDTAKGILRYTNNAPEDPHIKKLGTNQKTNGGSPEDPKVEMKWWKFFATDKWSVKGQLGQDENYLFYQDEKLKRQNRQRRVTIASSDPEDQTGQRLVLTKTAWDILREVPLPVPRYVDSIGITNTSGFASQSLEKPVQDKKGRWNIEAKPLQADSQTLGQMQRLIRSYVEKQVADGGMSPDILATVDGILKYKHGTLEPASYDGSKVVYRIKGKERPIVIERIPTLIDKIANEGGSLEGIASVEITPDEIKRYLTSKELPAGARIKGLQLELNGSTGRLGGIIDVPIPFVGGKINFDMELANNPDGSGLVVTKHHVETKSGTLRSKLGDLETNLSNINGFISDDINEQLRYRNPFLRVLGLLITPDGKFSVKVKNSKQAAA